MLASDRNGRFKVRPPSPKVDLELLIDDPELLGENPSLPEYDTEVETVQNIARDSYSCKDGDVDAKRVQMDDGTQYDLRVATPNELLSDTAITSGTAWFTHPDLELYQKGMRGALKLGYCMLLVGPPVGYEVEDVSLFKATYDFQRILDDQLPKLEKINPDLIVVKGPSRGAAMGFGSSVPQYAGNRKAPYADLTAPCTPRGFTKEEWPEARKHLGTELLSTHVTALDAAKKGDLIRYGKSLIPRSLSLLRNSARMLSTLSRGDAGVLADNADPSTATHIHEFTGDMWALKRLYEKKFEDQGRDNVAFTYSDGRHIEGIARPSTRRDTYARFERIRDIRGFDGSFDDVDFIGDVLPLRPFSDAEKASKNKSRIPRIYVPGIGKVA